MASSCCSIRCLPRWITVTSQPCGQQSARRLEPEQPATDHRGALARPGSGDHALRVVDGAEAEHARFQLASFVRSPVIGGMNARDPVAISSTS